MRMTRRAYLLLVPLGALLTMAAMVGRPVAARLETDRSRLRNGPEASRPAEVERPAGVPGRPHDKSAHAPPAGRAEPVPLPLFQVRVSPTLEIDEGQRARLQLLAERLSGVSVVPQARRDFFSAYEGALKVQIIGWHGDVQSVREAPQGSIVEVRVMPRLTLPYVTCCANYCEHYLVNPDGSLTYLKSLDPDGMSGLPPMGAALL